ncbi:MAG: tetratricopeptide repeat protein [Melioribacteraceae bacterium]|nr:tetratricopeptide repeat protein [Melioribacteraceae bacterium]
MMNKVSTDKFALIYQFNKSSPLFARVAAEALNKNFPEKAIQIIEEGLKIHPDYPTAYLVYSKALIEKGEFDNAREALKRVLELLEDEKTYNYYISEIERIEREKDIDPKQTSFVGGNLVEDQSFSVFSADNYADRIQEENFNVSSKSIEENLDSLIDELNEAKLSIQESDSDEIEKKDQDDDILSDEIIEERSSKFISETLADIYLSQGSLTQAKNIYLKLMEIEPEKKERFLNKIKMIDGQLKNE